MKNENKNTKDLHPLLPESMAKQIEKLKSELSEKESDIKIARSTIERNLNCIEDLKSKLSTSGELLIQTQNQYDELFQSHGKYILDLASSNNVIETQQLHINNLEALAKRLNAKNTELRGTIEYKDSQMKLVGSYLEQIKHNRDHMYRIWMIISIVCLFAYPVVKFFVR